MTDDELLDRLAKALAPPPVVPPEASMFALRDAVLGGRPRKRRLRPTRFAVPAFTALIATGIFGVAYAASGAAIPQPIRHVLRAVGVPVDGPEMADARAARDELREDLKNSSPAIVAKADQQLRARLKTLSPDERAKLEPEANDLIREAEAQISAARAPSPTGEPVGLGGADASSADAAGPSAGQTTTTTIAGLSFEADPIQAGPASQTGPGPSASTGPGQTDTGGPPPPSPPSSQAGPGETDPSRAPPSPPPSSQAGPNQTDTSGPSPPPSQQGGPNQGGG